jgi:hypothetical protein
VSLTSCEAFFAFGKLQLFSLCHEGWLLGMLFHDILAGISSFADANSHPHPPDLCGTGELATAAPGLRFLWPGDDALVTLFCLRQCTQYRQWRGLQYSLIETFTDHLCFLRQINAQPPVGKISGPTNGGMSRVQITCTNGSLLGHYLPT